MRAFLCSCYPSADARCLPTQQAINKAAGGGGGGGGSTPDAENKENEKK
jgi:hypothetical protein